MLFISLVKQKTCQLVVVPAGSRFPPISLPSMEKHHIYKVVSYWHLYALQSPIFNPASSKELNLITGMQTSPGTNTEHANVCT